MNDPTTKSISISPGNQKMGAIPSVSLPPVVTCPKGVPCSKDCYAARYCKMRPSVRAAYETNLEILQTNPVQYWLEVCRAAQLTRYFRFHVAGDIPDRDYAYEMIRLSALLPKTEFLCFTKNYAAVNDAVRSYIAANPPAGSPADKLKTKVKSVLYRSAAASETAALPKNLHFIFSDWPGMTIDNPFSFPTCRVLFPGDEPKTGEKLCGGNCSNCAIHDDGCWSLKPGETICIKKH